MIECGIFARAMRYKRLSNAFPHVLRKRAVQSAAGVLASRSPAPAIQHATVTCDRQDAGLKEAIRMRGEAGLLCERLDIPIHEQV